MSLVLLTFLFLHFCKNTLERVGYVCKWKYLHPTGGLLVNTKFKGTNNTKSKGLLQTQRLRLWQKWDHSWDRPLWQTMCSVGAAYCLGFFLFFSTTQIKFYWGLDIIFFHITYHFINSENKSKCHILVLIIIKAVDMVPEHILVLNLFQFKQTW